MPAIILNNVVLPHPEAPTKTVNFPSSMVRLRFSITLVSPKDLHTLRNSIFAKIIHSLKAITTILLTNRKLFAHESISILLEKVYIPQQLQDGIPRSQLLCIHYSIPKGFCSQTHLMGVSWAFNTS